MRVLVIGGGFFGIAVARHLASTRPNISVTLVEQQPQLLRRASYGNQARIHNGYHYPRSLTTAFRSRVNFPRFLGDFEFAVERNFTKLYAIARTNSRVTAKQFERFCKTIGARLEPAPTSLIQLFEPRLIEKAYIAEEWVFNADKLADWGRAELERLRVEICLNATVCSITTGCQNDMRVELTVNCEKQTRCFDRVFNCTYAGLAQIAAPPPALRATLKYEIAEMALVSPPPELANIGITVMDGPFFSLMPFPARQLHTLSHVRYTPLASSHEPFPYNPEQWPKTSRASLMLRDAARYVPALENAKYQDSLFETKALLQKSESDDGRPILFERHPTLPCYVSILGGKIDNVYDILEKIDAESL